MRVLWWLGDRLRAGWRWGRDRGVWRRLLAVTSAAVLLGVLGAIYGPLDDWAAGSSVRGISDPEKRAAAVNAVRQTLLATAAGVAAIIGLAFTARTFFLSRRGQLTDRYTKAITQLASDKLEERLGGIYALEHLMRESARDHQTVVDVLAAFVRERAPLPVTGTAVPVGPVGAETAPPRPDPAASPVRPGTDVQAALTVLGRRPARREPHAVALPRTCLNHAVLTGARLPCADLSGAQLLGARLSGAQLQGTDLSGSQLQGADLSGAQLLGARLRGAQLQGANLSGSQLEGARLREAQLQGADLSGAQLRSAGLSGAQLQGTYLARAQLRGTNLSGAQLQDAFGLTAAELSAAFVDDRTGLDPALRGALTALARRAAAATVMNEPPPP